MGIFDPRKPGLSNGVAKQEGFPTSGETSANAGALPAQRAQAPYEQNRAQTNMPQPTAKPPAGGGTLNGGAVQGAQYKTQAQNMNPGVASFVSIPQGLNAQPGGGFTPPQPAVPGGTKFQMQQQPQFFAGPQSGQQQQQQQQQPVSPSQPAAPQPQRPVQDNRPMGMPTAAPTSAMIIAPSQPEQMMMPAQPLQPAPAPAATPSPAPASQGAPTPTTDPANYDYLAEMQKMGQMYDIGGQYDLNQRAIAAEKARQQNMQAWTQNQLAGRGGTATQAQQNYMNTLAALESDTARAQLEQQAGQTELSNRLAFNKQIANTKMDLVKMANELGFNLDEEAYNQIAYEIANSYQGGRPVLPGEMVDMLKKGAKGTGSPEKQATREQQISDWINNTNPVESGESMYKTLGEMSDEEMKSYGPNKLAKAIAWIYQWSPQRGDYAFKRAVNLGILKP